MARTAKNPAAAADPFLLSLGERIRTLRAMRGMSRKALATGAQISERFLADMETGNGNASILLLRQVAQALGMPLTEIIGANALHSPDFSLITELLGHLDDAGLEQARRLLQTHFGPTSGRRATHIALIGLRGAGKSTLGRMLAQGLDYPFVELNHAIELATGVSTAEVHSLYGQSAYRRYERRCLEQTLQDHERVVIATPGSLVSEPATFNLLLTHCLTIWLKASPEEHMARVIAQGDMRPMAGNKEAMDDLKRILLGRNALYAKADIVIDTSGQPLQQSFDALHEAVVETQRSVLANHGRFGASRAA
jgi:XRE family aerobic/anaerobic benzoate catabolism transcriptional regulator